MPLDTAVTADDWTSFVAGVRIIRHKAEEPKCCSFLRINVSQTATINKAQLTQRVGVLPSKLMQEVEDGLRLVLGL